MWVVIGSRTIWVGFHSVAVGFRTVVGRLSYLQQNIKQPLSRFTSSRLAILLLYLLYLQYSKFSWKTTHGFGLNQPRSTAVPEFFQYLLPPIPNAEHDTIRTPLRYN